MATRKNKTLYNMEVPPPPAVWLQITARLNREYNAEEVPVAQKMYDMEFVPPTGIWDNIAATLPQQQEAAPLHLVKQPARIIAFARMATAAAAMVLITLTAWYFLSNSTDKNNTSIAKVKRSAADSGASASPLQLSDVASNRASGKGQPSIRNTAVDEGAAIASRYPNRGRYSYSTYDDQLGGANSESGSSYTSSRRSGGTTRRLRNAKGQLIMYNSSAADDDNCYIDITSPNGEQTRTSSKFMQILNSLNSDDDAPGDYFDFMLQDNSDWKTRIREWKNKLLNQTSFIPTGSVSDILELRDMLQDPQPTTDNQ